MNRLTTILLATLALSGTIDPNLTRASCAIEFITSIPLPCESCTGLTWDGAYLWIADGTTHRIHQTDSLTGKVLRSLPFPCASVSGLAWDGSSLWLADASQNKVCKLDPSNGAVLYSFALPPGVPQGLDFDGTYLWWVGQRAAKPHNEFKICCLTTTGDIVGTFTPYGYFPMGLAFDGTFLWQADTSTNRIYKINPLDWYAEDSFPASVNYPNDLAWDGTHLWLADNGTDRLYKFNAYPADEAFNKPAVLVCGTNKTDGLVDVQQKLQDTGLFRLVGRHDDINWRPEGADFREFDAVLVCGTMGGDKATGFGNVAASYVDAGGPLVCALFEVAGGPGMLGRWASGAYSAIPYGAQLQGTRATLGTVYDTTHPIMKKVAAFDGGPQSYRPAATNVAAGATRIADWSDGRPLVATRLIGTTRRVDLGFYPVSSDANAGSWDVSTDGARLMANALLWASHYTPVEIPAPVMINFDDVAAPSFFLDATPLTTEYAAQGVTFTGPGSRDGGAILSETAGGFTADPNSRPNVLAFSSVALLHSGGRARGPETLNFSPAVTSITLSAALASAFDAGALALDAYDTQGVRLDTQTVTLSTRWHRVTIAVPGVTRLVLTATARSFMLDDLAFAYADIP